MIQDEDGTMWRLSGRFSFHVFGFLLAGFSRFWLSREVVGSVSEDEDATMWRLSGNLSFLFFGWFCLKLDSSKHLFSNF